VHSRVKTIHRRADADWNWLAYKWAQFNDHSPQLIYRGVCHLRWRKWTLYPLDSTICHNQMYSPCLYIQLWHWLHSVAIQIHIPLRRDSSNYRHKNHMNLKCRQEKIQPNCFHPRGQYNVHWIFKFGSYVWNFAIFIGKIHIYE
jgi:hypothetical protein